jgi:hypothetical protein
MQLSQATLKGQFVVTSYDCSPALDRRNFMTVNAHFLNDDFVYRKICLGMFLVDGIGTGEQFRSAFNGIYNQYGLQIINWNDQFPSSDPDAHAYVVGAISDMGAGCYQATELIHGADGQTCCAAHGQNNITTAAVNVSQTFKANLDVLMETSKAIREKRETRIEARDVQLPMPGNPAKERWSRFTSAFKYYSKNAEKVRTLSAFLGNQRHKLDIAVTTLKPIAPIFECLGKSMDILQTPGPMMAFVLPFVVATVASEILEVTADLPDELRAVGECIHTRFLRRFFYKEKPGAVYAFGQSDRTRTVSLFKNIFVTAAFGLIPTSTQMQLVEMGVVGATSVTDIADTAKHSLERLHRLVDPTFFDQASSVTTSAGDRRGKGSLWGSRSSSATAPTQPIDLHLAHIARVTADPRIADYFVEMGRAYDDGLNLGHARERLLQLYLEVIDDIVKLDSKAGWLRKVLRIVAAWPGTTVECERDFSWLQRILSEHRLRLGEIMISAYLVVKQNYFVVEKVLAMHAHPTKKNPKLPPGQTSIVQHFGRDVPNERKQAIFQRAKASKIQAEAAAAAATAAAAAATAAASVASAIAASSTALVASTGVVMVAGSDALSAASEVAAATASSASATEVVTINGDEIHHDSEVLDDAAAVAAAESAELVRRSKRVRRSTARAERFFQVIRGKTKLDPGEQDAFKGEDEEAGFDVAAERERLLHDALAEAD